MKYVISLGGSIIVPDEINYSYLKKLSLIINKFSKNNKIVIVTGGGYTARKYINSLRKDKLNEDIYSLIGIATTKLNARLINGFFNKIMVNLPDSLEEVKRALNKDNIVIVGSLGFQPDVTSDGDAAQIAEYLKADFFINLTNVNGLYDKNPKEHKDARLIKEITFDKFYSIARKHKFKAGMHFVLDYTAANIIKRARIKTLIINGLNLKNLENSLKGDKFVGTVIHG